MSPRKADKDKPALSRPFDVDTRRDFPVEVEVVADAAERAALADLLDVDAIRSLVAPLRVTKNAGGRFHVTGVVKAKVTRVSVVSLEPFDTNITESIDLFFAPPTSPGRGKAGASREILVSPDDDDPPDPIIDGKIDLGAVVAEFLALGLDPYPRRADEAFDAPPAPEDEKPESPFAELGRLSGLKKAEKE